MSSDGGASVHGALTTRDLASRVGESADALDAKVADMTASDSRHTVDVPSISLPELDQIKPGVGARFPDFTLPNQWGEPVDFHTDRAGRKALLVWVRSADW